MSESLRRYAKVSACLDGIAQEMKCLGLWQAQAPNPELLQSTEPFCIDTLELTQWLQFVFLSKMSFLIEQKMPLPSRCSIAPMISEYFKGRPENVDELELKLAELDQILESSSLVWV